ncbi:SUMF1/EgtB/PvdO family nonheme iron enzyme [Candidatus Magnetaquicoccus inordinatus]|uniref:SUMF1/EgtB/PvdO family nonheme iron enzyme n=1 Tax=Candidatus Magnetaquicoccus inordinatus TaxID=2496818 RepID=UPI00102CD121|nr:SUMF1/EgtB/PvdO family nonheme iron enzyme [Candidatus Magnetaquicoccus inordinatus]
MNLRNTPSTPQRQAHRQGSLPRRFATRGQQPAAVRVRRTTGSEQESPRQRRRIVRLLLGMLLVGVALLLLRISILSMPDLPAISWPNWSLPEFSVGNWFAGSSFFTRPAEQGESVPAQVAESSSCVMTVGAGQKTVVGPFNMLTIPAGQYELPLPASPLYPFLHPQRLGSIVLPEAILLQEQPVSSSVFKQYVEDVGKMPDGEAKEERLSHIGMFWNKKESVSPAVRGISLEAAMDFNRWLSEKTGCEFQIPSREEWAAAVIHLFQSGVSLPKPSDGFDATPLKSLLQGGSEWTRSTCPMGYYLVGEEDWGATIRDGHPSCMPNLFSVAGFRTVIHPAATNKRDSAEERKSNH